eukprot:7016309-Prymnesium_polylepis.1
MALRPQNAGTETARSAASARASPCDGRWQGARGSSVIPRPPSRHATALWRFRARRATRALEIQGAPCRSAHLE